MPDLPPTKRRTIPFTPPGDRPTKPVGRTDTAPPVRYAELHCLTNFSFLEGASHPDELVNRAVELGLSALAVTDRNSLAGAVRAHVAAKAAGLKLLIGAEVTSTDGPPIVLWATGRAAYGRLSRLLTVGRRRSKKGECSLTFDDLAAHADGLIAGVLLRSLPGEDAAPLHACRDIYGGRCYGLVSRHLGPNDPALVRRLLRLADEAGIPPAASNDVRYHTPERRYLHDVLTAVRHKCAVAELGHRLLPNAERHLKSPGEMAALFALRPELIARTVEIADRCAFSLDELRYEYPEELAPPGLSPLEHLTRLTWAGARGRYPQGIPAKVRRLLEHELALIAELNYEAYFLTVWDLVRFARSRGILCQGRGSAANSAVCYCLGVTAVDPDRIDVLFERFISRERDEAPDIDVDFEHERREEVIQYLYEKYGRERAGLAATIITYRPRSAVRDVGKALGLSLDRVDALAKSLGSHSVEGSITDRFREAGLDPHSVVGKRLIHLVTELLGFPRHLSQHVGGMVITRGRLDELVPVENAAMKDRTVIQWDKDDLDALGLLKVDVLALGMLSAIRRCFGLLESHYNRPMTLADVPPEDPAVYDMACRADTIGVFQIESRAQMAMLPRLRPQCFYDLVIQVSLVRPGPIQGDMVHPYLRRRDGLEGVEYPDERVKEVLHKTLGVPIFQEQAMRLAVVAAGFTLGEADELRRAMAAWRRKGVIDKFREKLQSGLLAGGYSAEFAERLYKQIQGFGEYGFPESHAASFALLVYVSAWLKCHYPAAFTAALLNSQPMGFYAPSQLVADARAHGVTVHPIDVNHSEWNCTLEPLPEEGDEAMRRSCDEAASGSPHHLITSSPHPSNHRTDSPPSFALRLGLRMVRGFSRIHADRIVTARGEGRFADFRDFARRTGLSSATLKTLTRADAFGSLRLGRRAALWHALPEQTHPPLLAGAEPTEPPVAFPTLPPMEEILADYAASGLSLRGHPLQFLREALSARRVTPAAELVRRPDGDVCSVAGLVLVRQRPGSARGVTFITVEDETGTANLIVWPDVWERHHAVARGAQVLLAHGCLQRQSLVAHLVVDRLEDASTLLPGTGFRSRDFH